MFRKNSVKAPGNLIDRQAGIPRHAIVYVRHGIANRLKSSLEANCAELTKLQLSAGTFRPVTKAAALTAAEQAHAQAKRARALIAVARARLTNSWLRLAACAIVAIVATSVVGNLWPLAWVAGLALVIVLDRVLFTRVRKHCEAHRRPPPMFGLIVWIIAQSAYGNMIAAMLYFAPYVPGETLAAFYLCGSLANAAASLRSSAALTLAGAGTTIVFLFGLPLAVFYAGGAQNSLELMPLVGGLLLLGFAINLWKSLVASDEAQLQAEAAAVRERQAAASAAAAKSDTIRRMNDELRTPMQALIGAAEHLRRVASSPQARAQIATLVEAGEVLKLVLDDLSDLDRLENGALHIDMKPADPREIARGVVSAFRAAAQDKHLELFLDIGPGIPAFVEIDPLRVRQILFNLLANAVRYTTTGGVRVRLSAQRVGEARARLLFQVADTGAGMSQAQLALIFGRERLSMDGDGPGLGLAISRKLARAMGGQLSARSEVGGGSMFSLLLEAPVFEVGAALSPEEPRQLAR